MAFKDQYPVLSASIEAIFAYQEEDCPDLDTFLIQEVYELDNLEALAASLKPAELDLLTVGVSDEVLAIGDGLDLMRLIEAKPELEELDYFLQAVWEGKFESVL